MHAYRRASASINFPAQPDEVVLPVTFQIPVQRTGRVQPLKRCASFRNGFPKPLGIAKNELLRSAIYQKALVRPRLLTIVEFHARKCHLPAKAACDRDFESTMQGVGAKSGCWLTTSFVRAFFMIHT